MYILSTSKVISRPLSGKGFYFSTKSYVLYIQFFNKCLFFIHSKMFWVIIYKRWYGFGFTILVYTIGVSGGISFDIMQQLAFVNFREHIEISRSWLLGRGKEVRLFFGLFSVKWSSIVKCVFSRRTFSLSISFVKLFMHSNDIIFLFSFPEILLVHSKMDALEIIGAWTNVSPLLAKLVYNVVKMRIERFKMLLLML